MMNGRVGRVLLCIMGMVTGKHEHLQIMRRKNQLTNLCEGAGVSLLSRFRVYLCIGVLVVPRLS
jgi:hypothetical protein